MRNATAIIVQLYNTTKHNANAPVGEGFDTEILHLGPRKLQRQQDKGNGSQWGLPRMNK